MKILKKPRSTSTKGHYVTNAVLLPEVIKCKELGYITDDLARMLLLIAERYSRKSNFVGYSFREDMVSAAMINLSRNALKFNPEASNNPFSYYTTALHRSFLQYLADEKKHRDLRDQLLIDAGANPSFNFMEKENDSPDDYVESDEREYKAESEVNPDKLPDAKKGRTDSSEAQTDKTLRWGRSNRLPGEVTTFKPEDISYDENGKMVLKKNGD